MTEKSITKAKTTHSTTILKIFLAFLKAMHTYSIIVIIMIIIVVVVMVSTY